MRSVDRIIGVCDALESSQGGMTVSDIATATDLNRAVVHRLVTAMTAHGLVERSSSGRYRIGPRALLYSNSYLDQLAIRRIALPYLVDLRESLLPNPKVVVSLNIRIGSELAVVESLWDYRSSLDSMLHIGGHHPLVETSGGTAIAAYMAEESLIALIGAERARDLQPRFREIRHAGGIDFSVGEYRAAIHGVSATVFAETSTDIAISAYGRDLDLAVINRDSDFARSVRRTADAIGEAMRSVRP